MKCPRCRSSTGVADSRADTASVVRRRRQCEGARCGYKFTTYEIVEDEVARQLQVTISTHLWNGRIAARTTVERRCPCGKPAKYVLPDETEPSFCRTCNRGRGRPLAAVGSRHNATKGDP